MKRQILITLLISCFTQTFASATVWTVPGRDLQKIQDAIDVAVNGDEIIVMPGTYTGQDNVDLDFKGKAITLRSNFTNPDNPEPDIVAATIINCQGDRFSPHRAFYFHTNEGPDSKVIGFTIINGYQRGSLGTDGFVPPLPFGSVPPPAPGQYRFPDPEDPELFGPYANDGSASDSTNGNGGAIYCVGASPTIKHCVISNCTVTGSHGGKGADGYNGEWQYVDPDDPCEVIDVDSGQWAGRGGPGFGEGRGGAISCVSTSNPVISNCIIKDNIARGGCGGDGGRGGEGEGRNDFAGAGGDGGRSYGDGKGGAIYADSTSVPTITGCQFINNIATTGERSSRGGMGAVGDVPLINEEPIDFPDGIDGSVHSGGTVAGGACYYLNNGHLNFDDCNFIENKAYEANIYFDLRSCSEDICPEDIAAYTKGGAIYSSTGGDVHLNDCKFISNLGSAVYCESSCNLDFDDCAFNGNAEAEAGGAVYVDTGSTVDLRNCTFSGNSALSDGGALESKSSLTLTDCSFGGNTAQGPGGQYFSGYGGAVDVYRAGATLTVDADNCRFTENQAAYGGAFYGQADANFIDCYFIANTAERGGGLDIEGGSLRIINGAISGNNATLEGGGAVSISGSDLQIRNCTIINNSASGLWAYGGAIDFYGPALQTVFNCLLAGNSSDLDGGAIYSYYATSEIANSTFSDNTADGFGGAVFSGYNSSSDITDSIFHNCSSHAIHEGDGGGNATPEFCLFYDNPDGDYYDSGTHQVYNGNTGPYSIHNIPGGSVNIYGDPLFEGGALGALYLNQASLAVDSGSASSASLGLDTYTTDPDNTPDSGQVDRGYHYLIVDPDTDTFQLTASVIGGGGTVVPTAPQPIDYDPILDVYTYYVGTVVTLTANPNPGLRVKGWGGTDNDFSTETNNIVIMDSDKTITVQFEQPKTLIVTVGGGVGYYSNIQAAVHDAADGDTIVVYPGTYYGGYGEMIGIDRDVEIRSLHPDDPACVEATIIDGYRYTPFPDPEDQWTYIGVVINPGVEAVLNGFTIQNCGGVFGPSGRPGSREQGHPNGYDGGSGMGAAIWIFSGENPVIKNCIIRDNIAIGGSGGVGEDATVAENAGRGGWGGWVHGGAIYCTTGSNPTFINCRIIDNEARGGNGGNGGEGLPPGQGGVGNYGGNWSRRQAIFIDPYNLTTSFVWGDLWEIFAADTGGSYIGDYRWYTAYGGGVFCDVGSTVTFIDCNITENHTYGGVSGQGGRVSGGTSSPEEPLIPFEMPSFGGGVYCAANSDITFDGCILGDNTASRPADYTNHHRDPYLGHGGGVCAEDTAVVTFIDCNFVENQACVGGGVYFTNSNPLIKDSNFISNTAYQGGAVFGDRGLAAITGCYIYDNEATIIENLEPNDPNMAIVTGQGGGLHLWAVDANINDCYINGNMASSSGGGVYFGGENNISLKNCLVTENIAARDGGGVSANIFSQLTVSNCTIVGNVVAGAGFDASYGGGVYCSYETTADIINSIIWANFGTLGAQLAVGTGYEYDPAPSLVNVSYTDIGPPYDPCDPFDYLSGDDTYGASTGQGTGTSTLVDADTIYGLFDAGQNSVRVIVSLFEPTQLRLQTDWNAPASVATLRTEIDNRQATVLSALSPAEFGLRYRFENQTAFSGRVSIAGLNKLLADPLVQYIEPVRELKRMLAQGISLINAEPYRSRYNGQGIAIAICDDGIDYTHPMLGGGVFPNDKVIGGYDFGDNDPDPMHSIGTDPTAGHGTCVAGIAAGDLGQVGDYTGGVAYNAKIYALKISDANGSLTTDEGLAAWDWCVTHRNDDPNNPIKVVNNSWGTILFGYTSPAAAEALYPALYNSAQNLLEVGITVLAAAGNDSFINALVVPAALSNVISVGAVDDVLDTVMPYSDTASFLDILAPSDYAYTTDIVGTFGYSSGDYEPYFNGTSAACPYAAGAVADLQAAAFDIAGVYLTPAQIRHLLIETGDPVTDTKAPITKPRINLGQAILRLVGSPIYVEQNCTLNGWDYNPNTGLWDPNYTDFGNITEDPCFIAGYLLRQVAAGQDVNSPCVDAGSANANDPDIGMDTYTTRIDGAGDSGIVDMGFHYPMFTPIQYQLTVTALEVDGFQPHIFQPDPNIGYYDWYRRVPLEVNSPPSGYQVVWIGTDDDAVTNRYNYVTMDSDRYVFVAFGSNKVDLTVEIIGNGTVSPMSGTYDRGTVVDLIATPAQGYRVSSWSGTDDDTSTATTNTVTMAGDITVTVEFEQTRTLEVPGDYASPQEAFDAAGAGDTILIGPGIWGTSTGFLIQDTPLIITGTAPDEPNVVANTIIEMQAPPVGGWVSTAFTFRNVGPEAVLNGITIRGFQMRGTDGVDAEEAGESGTNGNFSTGGAIDCYAASPSIKNCRIENCSVTGGNGGNGYNGGDPNFNGGHGGWPGYAFGGALACLTDYYGNPSNPVVTNCIFINCSAIGGNGGDGGNGSADPPGNGGRGGGWYYGSDSFWYGVPWPYGPYYHYTRYSGKGGAVYVGPDCAPVFDHCTFTNNTSFSGTCGISGQDAGNQGREEPARHWLIENSGGAAYCDTDSSPKFTDCVFNNNTADINDPNYNDDPYVSFGGAVAFEDGAMPVFERCTFNDNLATIGGAIYSGTADARISDSNFVLNLAYHGAGIYCDNSDVTIEGCNIVGNIASVLTINAPNDMNNIEILGHGGGIYCNSASARIADCNISANQADASGGGICFSGVGTPVLTNCLLTENIAGRDGGAVSVDWFCELAVRNCTVLDNTVVGNGFDNSYGGGLYCCYGSTTSIVNSIFWGNDADNGVQLGIGTGFEFDPRPSTLNVSYSDVHGMRFGVYVDQDCTLNWGAGNIGIDPEFITGPLGDYYLSRTDTGDPNQTTDSPCVDAGSDYASRFGLLMYTTRTDQIYDKGLVDMGYHYRLTKTAPTCRFCNLNLSPSDGVINIYDLAVFASFWLNQACSAGNQWCMGADFDLDTDVDFTDYAFFSQCWLTDSAPVPNPSLWAAVPYLTSGTAISMAAEGAVAPWGGDVQYYFDCLSGPCHDSGWQDSNTYNDTGLAPQTEYSYRVKARDEKGSETEWSDVAYIVTIEEAADITPPTPDPMIWAPAPYATSTTSIAMAADTAYDISGVEYYFDCISGGCHDSGWQDSNTYVDAGLVPDTTYTYRVRARDLSLWRNATQWSVNASATTFPLGDTTPPAPPPVIIFDPNTPPVTGEFQIGLDWWHRIVATTTATDASGIGYYIAVCLDDPSLTSGQLQAVAGIVMYEVDVDKYGGQYSPEHQWQVFVYDIYNNGIGSQIVTVGGAPPL